MFTAKRPLVIGLVAILALGGGGYWWAHRGQQHTDDAAIEAHIVPISAKVAGYVNTVMVEDNQTVARGAVLVTIAPDDFENRLAHARAIRDAARANLARAQADYASAGVTAPSVAASARAGVAAAASQLSHAISELKRYQGLGEYASPQQIASLRDAVATAQANLAAARAQVSAAGTGPHAVEAAGASVANLRAQLAGAEADLRQATEDRANTTIQAPMTGTVAKRGVEPGAYIQPGQQLMSLVSTSVWVVANFKETQLTDMRPGQAVDIRVDAYPHHPFKGHVESIQRGTGARFSIFPPENATGNFVKVVQRVPVRIVFDTPPGRTTPLVPGMSVRPVVHTR
jgi:membrane fusion protein (multidrug efflux system)